MPNEKKTESRPTQPPASARSGDRRKEREQARQRTTLLVVVGGVVLVVGLIILGLLEGRRPVDAPFPEAALSRYEGLPQGRTTTTNYPRLGDPGVSVQVALYSSFDCEPCKVYFENLRDPLLERVRDGLISLTFVPLYGYGTITNGQGAARAALCAGEQGRFWEFAEGLFEWQQYGRSAFSNARIVSGVANLGIDAGAHDACIRGGSTDGILGTARVQARDLLNFEVPPAITINNAIPTDENNVVIVEPAALIAAVDRAIENLTAAAQPDAEETAEPEATPDAEATGEANEEATPDAESTPEVTDEATATPRPTRTARPTAEPTSQATEEAAAEATQPG
jgi:protein-disulfide isomerase